jgi:hypothetical protein
MLILLKNKQHKIASVTLAIIMGGWLLFVCQACLAAVDDINAQSETTDELSNYCHSPKIDDSIDKISDVNSDHCLGVCDCDAITISMNSEKSSDLIEKTKFSPDLYTYIEPQIKISSRAQPTYQLSTTPERAIFLPQQHYTVLLN